MHPARTAAPLGSAPTYTRRRPEHTLLYQLVEQHYPHFLLLMTQQGSPLPLYVQQEFDDFLKCGRLEHGFLRVRCEDCKHEHLVAFSCKRRGFCPSCGARRMTESAALHQIPLPKRLPEERAPPVHNDSDQANLFD